MLTIPDKGEGLNDTQSILFQEYIDVIIAGIAGVDCVVSGCAVTPSAGMVIAVAAGSVRSNDVTSTVSSATPTVSAAHATLPRLDLVVVNSAGAVAIRAGTAASAPKPPARTANDVVLAVVYVPALNATIATNQIVDMRTVNTALSFIQAGVGATLRTVQDKARDTVSVFDFMTDAEIADVQAGTALVDVTAAIQAAITASASAKKKLLFNAGTYLCGDIDVKSNTHVVAEKGAIIQRASNYGWQLGVTYTDPDNVTIDGLSFDNDATGTAHTHKFCMFIGNPTNVNILNCKFYNGTDASMAASLGPDGVYIRSLSPTTVNNIRFKDCTFDGFSRNGVSITDGVNTIKFDDCTFSNCGLAGLDAEANVGSSVQAYNLTVNSCLFINNGDDTVRGIAGLMGSGLAIFSASPTAYHSENTVVSNCYFKTTTARNATGLYYLKINSAKNSKVVNCTFDDPDDTGTAASAHTVTLESSTFGSESMVVDANTFNNVPLVSFNVNGQVVSNNTFNGALSRYTSAAYGYGRVISGNTFYNAGSAADLNYVVYVYSPNAVISNNTFVDTRNSDVPAEVVRGSSDTTQDVRLIVSNNNCQAYGSDTWDAFFSYVSVAGTSTYHTDLQIINNFITGTATGIKFNSSTLVPNVRQIMVSGNQIQNTTGYGIQFYRGTNLSICNNQLTDCAGGSDMVRLDGCTKYIVNGNIMVDSRATTSRAVYGINAFNSPDTKYALISSNLTVNTQTGNSIAANDAEIANNIVV